MSSDMDRIECPQAWSLIEGVCQGGLPGKVAVELRRHLARCPDCKARYRERIELTASLGASVRARGGARHGSRGPRWLGTTSRERRWRGALLFVVSSLLIAMVARLDGDWNFEPGMRLEVSEGAAWAGGHLVEATAGQVFLERSDLVEVESGARARIASRSLEFELEPGVRLLVVSALAQRLRLERGTIEVAGEGRLETPRGVVELDEGRARVTVTPRSLEVVPLSGRVVRTDARGRERLEVAVGSFD
jgi:hypothetical protein